MPATSLSKRLTRIGSVSAKLVGWHRRADLLYVRTLEGFLSRKKATLLYDMTRALEGEGAIAEIGSWKGKSTVLLALACRRSGRKGPVYAIDHHEGSEELQELIAQHGKSWPVFQETIREAGVAELVHPLRMSSLEGAKWLADNGVRLRLLFVDGAHDEASVRAEIEALEPLLLPGSIVAFDDARPEGSFPGVYRAYEKHFAPRAPEIARGGSLLVTRYVGPGFTD